MKDLIQNARAVEARLREANMHGGEIDYWKTITTIADLCTALEAAQADAEHWKLKYKEIPCG